MPSAAYKLIRNAIENERQVTCVYEGRLKQAAASRRPAWCIFDNTALGAATENALALAATVARTLAP